MRSRIDFIATRVEQNLEESGVDANGDGVCTLAWKEWPADAVTDPVTGAKQGEPTPRTCKVPAFLHFVAPSSVLRQFAEIEKGDCIMDLSPLVNLKTSDTGLARAELRFIIDGDEFVAKPMSAHLAKQWDVMQGGRKLFQTILLRRAT